MPDSDPPPQLLTRAEVAKLLAVSERQISRLVARGLFPVVRLGPQSVRFRLSDVQAAIDRLAEGEK